MTDQSNELVRMCNGGPDSLAQCRTAATLVVTTPQGLQCFTCPDHTDGHDTEPMAPWFERHGMPVPASVPLEWLPIPGFDGAYELRRDGQLRSHKTWRGYKGPMPRTMKVQVRPNGRRYIQLGLHGGVHCIDALLRDMFGIPLPELVTEDKTPGRTGSWPPRLVPFGFGQGTVTCERCLRVWGPEKTAGEPCPRCSGGPTT